MKPFLIVLCTMAWIETIVLVNHASAAQTAQQKQDAHKQQKEQERENQKKRFDAVQAVMKAKDKNHDGSLSLEEYIDGEADAAAAAKAFDKFNKNKDRFLSKAELAASLEQ